MLKSIYDWFGFDELIEFKAFKKLAVFIAIEYALFTIIMLAFWYGWELSSLPIFILTNKKYFVNGDKKMKDKKEFNQQQYIKQYNQTHYKTFKVELKKEEKEELDELLKSLSMTKAAFLRNAIKELKEKGDLKKWKIKIMMNY